MESQQCSFYDVPCHLSWLSEEIQSIFIYMYDVVLQSIAALFISFPAPDFLLSVSTLTLPSSVIYLANIFAVPEGLAIIVSASTLSFIIRRIPVIG